MATANTRKITGKLYVRVGGELLPITSEGTHSVKGLGGLERETEMGLDQAVGYREKAVEASVETTIALKAGYSLASLIKIEDATVQVESDAGQVYVLANAWCKSVGDLGSDGRVTVAFAGPAWKETATSNQGAAAA
ncbi:MAG: hypothetical protein C4525_03155 [Desulfarculus sp.]|jgi:hypothetical protein|nr:MAG: hypothetical protein C4525_03155 [Desulfarculus sp.]